MSFYMQSAMQIEDDVNDHPVTVHAEQEQVFSPASSLGVVAEEPFDFSSDPDLQSVLANNVSPAIEYVIKSKILYEDVPYNIRPEDLIEVLKCGSSRKINVRFIRKVLPALRVISCHKVLEYEGKRKIKRLWHDVPADWPAGLPHKDPNNGEKPKNGSGIPKANGGELKAMFHYLRMKFFTMLQREVNNLSESESAKANETYSCVSHQPSEHIPTMVQRISDRAATATFSVAVSDNIEMEVDQREPAGAAEVQYILTQPTQDDSYTFLLNSDQQYVSTQETYAMTINADDEKYQFTGLVSDNGEPIYITQPDNDVAEVEQEVTTNSEVADVAPPPKELSPEARVYVEKELIKLREKTGACIQKCLGEELGLVNLMSQSYKVMESLGNSGDLEQFIAASSALSSVLDMAVFGAISDGDVMTRLTGILEGVQSTAAPVASKLVPSTSLNDCTNPTLSEHKNAQMGQQVFTVAHVQEPDRDIAAILGIKPHVSNGTLDLLEHVHARSQNEMHPPQQWMEFKDADEKEDVLEGLLQFEEECKMAIGPGSQVLHDVNMQVAAVAGGDSTATNNNMSYKSDDTNCVPVYNPVRHDAPRLEIPPRPVGPAITSPVILMYRGFSDVGDDDEMECDD